MHSGQKQPTGGPDAEHAMTVARHVRDEIEKVSRSIASRGSQLRTSEIYMGLAEVILKLFIDHEGLASVEKIRRFGDDLAETLCEGLIRAKAKHSLRN